MPTELKPNQEDFQAEDIERISRAIEIHKNNPETSNLEYKDIVKRSVETTYGPDDISTASNEETAAVQAQPDFLPNYVKDDAESIKSAITALVSLAKTKGIRKAVALARQKEPYIMDAFHDALVDHLIPFLKSKNLF